MWIPKTQAVIRRLPDGGAGWMNTPPVILVSGELMRCEDNLLPWYGRAYSVWEYDAYIYAWRPLHLILRLAYWLYTNQYFIEHWGYRQGFYVVEPNTYIWTGRWTWRRAKR